MQAADRHPGERDEALAIYGRRASRIRPGSITVKPSRSRAPSLATASTTAAGLARRARLGNFTRMTPADPPARMDEFAEVGVLGEQHAPLVERALHDPLVG